MPKAIARVDAPIRGGRVLRDQAHKMWTFATDDELAAFLSSHPDARPHTSERRVAAEYLSSVIIEAGMTTPFGGDITRARDGRSYDILLSLPAVLDGLVRVYSPNFVLVLMQGRRAPGRAGRWRAAYRSAADVASLLKAVAEGRMRDAEMIEPIPQTR